MGSWRCLAVAGLLSSGACSDSAAQLECEPAQTQPLALVLDPPPPTEGTSRSFELHTACVVASLSDAPASLHLSCANPGESIEFTLAAAGSTSAELGSGLVPGDAVELDYATIADVARTPAWAAVRRKGEFAPTVVAIAAWQPTPSFVEDPDFASPLVFEFRGDTRCAKTRGSCNVGPKRRAAVELSIDGEDFPAVFDRNSADVGDYRVHVGEATRDEGNCEGVNETWYEVLVARVR